MNIAPLVSAGSAHSLIGPLSATSPAGTADRDTDLAPVQRVGEADAADRVEISDVSKALATLSEQREDGPELQLPPQKLRQLTEG